MAISIKCPSCGKSGIWNKENAFRPFCSERCKLIDLGAWAAEEHRIPDETTPFTQSNDDDKDV